MTPEEKDAYEWALNQSYGSVAAQYAKILALCIKKQETAECIGLCRLWVRDKTDGRVHEVGTEQHDAMWVTDNGEIHYHNLQNGDGACGGGDSDNYGYIFVPSDDGMLDAK